MKSLLSSDGFFCGFNPNKPLLKNLSKQKAFLTIVSSVFLFSCSSYTKSFESRAIPVERFTPTYLKNFKENSFKISIEAYGNHFGGILATKKLKENHFRFAFLNEFGGKMLDFELINQELKLNYAIDELNKKIILNLLKKDFNLLFHENNKVLNAYENNGYMILQSEINKKPV